MSSPNDLHFPLQIGVKWRDAATTFSLFCSPRSPNRTGFGMGRLKPRPTFSPHSRYGTSSRRASVARAHVVVLMGHPVSRNANVLNQKRFLIAPSVRFTTQWSRDLTTPGKKRLSGRELPWRIAPVAMFSPETKRIEYKRSAPRRTRALYSRFSVFRTRLATCLVPLTSKRAAILLHSIANVELRLAASEQVEQSTGEELQVGVLARWPAYPEVEGLLA